jgi:hypothetical protein
MPQHDMTAPLIVKNVADFSQGSDYLTARDTWQTAHTLTSTTSSEIAGGTGSPWARKLSK